MPNGEILQECRGCLFSDEENLEFVAHSAEYPHPKLPGSLAGVDDAVARKALKIAIVYVSVAQVDLRTLRAAERLRRLWEASRRRMAGVLLEQRR
jgi:hypothetical protein